MLFSYDIYNDGGHGWLKVRKSDIENLGINDKITHYSYMRNDWAYLEEDCDAPLYVNALIAKYGKQPKFRNHYCDRLSKIRTYQHFE